MKDKSQERCKNDIIKRRDELHRLIENERINSKIVQRRSRELDRLISLYYKQCAKCQELKDP
ncbi:MAG: aspartyl-phosphate phosphatase Spo0E family protein [Clostridiaceae bacterium]